MALSAASPVRADDCGRPAIFWISGSGSFDSPTNFASAGGEVRNCAPLPTDNVSFGAYPGVFPTSGTIAFAGGETVNSLLVDSSGWTFSLGGDINVTQGIVFGDSSLTISGGHNVLASSSDGVLSGDTLSIPDGSGFIGASTNITSLSMTGGGNISVDKNSVISSMTLAGGSQLQLTGAGFLDLGTGTIGGSTVTATGGTVLLSADHSGQALTIGGGAHVNAAQLYVGLGYGNTVTASGAGTALTGAKTFIYDTLQLQNGASLSGGALTIGSGLLAISGGAQAASGNALVSGAGSASNPGATVSGPGSLWTVNGTLTVSNGAVNVGSGGALNVAGTGSLILTSVAGKSSYLSINGGSLSDVNATLGYAPNSAAVASVQGGTWKTSGTLLVGQDSYGALLQTGGSITTKELSINAGPSNSVSGYEYDISGGSLQVTDSATIANTVQQTGGTVSITNNLAQTALKFLVSGATLDVGGNVTVGTQGGTSASFVAENSATVSVTGNVSLLSGQIELGPCGCKGPSTDSSTITVDGSVLVATPAETFGQNGGKISVGQNLALGGDYILTSGNLAVGVKTQVAGGTFSQIGGTASLAALSAYNGGAVKLDGGALQASSLTIFSGSQFLQTAGTGLVTGNVANAGTLGIVGSTLQVQGTYVQTAGGTLALESGGKLDPTLVSIGGGSVSGAGTIVGNTNVSQGTVNAGGASPGVLNVQGSYTQSGGSIVLAVGANGHGGFSTSALEFTPGDAVSITHTNVVLDFLSGANPAAFFAGAHVGEGIFFTESNGSALALSAIGTGDTFDYQSAGGALVALDYNPGTGGLTTSGSGGSGVPEPATWLLMLTGCGALVLKAQARQRRCHLAPG